MGFQTLAMKIIKTERMYTIDDEEMKLTLKYIIYRFERNEIDNSGKSGKRDH